MKPNVPEKSRRAEIARIAAHLGALAEEQGPLLFLAELETMLAGPDAILVRDLAAMFRDPTDISPPNPQADWQRQEKLLAALVAARIAA